MQKISGTKEICSKRRKTIAPDDATIEERMTFYPTAHRLSKKWLFVRIFLKRLQKRKSSTTFLAILELMKKMDRSRGSAKKKIMNQSCFYPAVGDTQHDEIK